MIDAEDPTVVMKAVKNEVQLENLRKAHLKDAVAMCKFMYWLKTNIGKIPMTEISASDYLASLRAEQEGFLDLSFATICGYADHGAIVHYSATEESDRQLKPESLLLVDSGGHYLEGTTDITRTFALGPVTARALTLIFWQESLSGRLAWTTITAPDTVWAMCSMFMRDQTAFTGSSTRAELQSV